MQVAHLESWSLTQWRCKHLVAFTKAGDAVLGTPQLRCWAPGVALGSTLLPAAGLPPPLRPRG